MKVYAYLAVVLAACGILWGVYYLGGSGEREKSAELALEHARKETALLEEVQKAKEQREVVYRDKIKIVEKASDACLDTAMPADVRMQLSGGSKAK